LEQVTPVYKTMPGWQKDTSKAKRYSELPTNAKRYLRALEEMVQAKIKIVSVGSKRSQTIIL